MYLLFIIYYLLTNISANKNYYYYYCSTYYNIIFGILYYNISLKNQFLMFTLFCESLFILGRNRHLIYLALNRAIQIQSKFRNPSVQGTTVHSTHSIHGPLLQVAYLNIVYIIQVTAVCEKKAIFTYVPSCFQKIISIVYIFRERG